MNRTRGSSSDRCVRTSCSGSTHPNGTYRRPGWYRCPASRETMVTSASTRRATRLATMVPPVPPPTTATRGSIVLPRLAHDEPCESRLVDDAEKLMPRLLAPLGDVAPAAGVARQHLDDLPHAGFADRPDQFHQGTRAIAAPRVDRSVDLRLLQLDCHDRCLLDEQRDFALLRFLDELADADDVIDDGVEIIFGHV